MHPSNQRGLNPDRGRHEIPLLNEETGEVRYGLEAMTSVLAEGMPRLRPLLKHPWLPAFLKPLSWLITYTRRVIAGTKPPTAGFDCAPDYHAGWRTVYVGLMAVACLLVGLPPFWLSVGLALAGIAGYLIHDDELTFAGHAVTVLFMVCVVTAIIPGTPGLLLGYAVAAWEGWRRA